MTVRVERIVTIGRIVVQPVNENDLAKLLKTIGGPL